LQDALCLQAAHCTAKSFRLWRVTFVSAKVTKTKIRGNGSCNGNGNGNGNA